jgi:phenylpropionate dioxygenase-like ring-hydroxylating dioxygenase large terminal subunit
MKGLKQSGLAINGILRVPKERYYDRDFFELEREKLWYKTWQLACRLQEIPESGDYVEYEIFDQSILIVHQKDGSLKAFFNVCPHRATQIAKGEGTFHGGQMTCPFHGWRWNLDGSSSFVYGEQGFAPECMNRNELALRECKLEVWGDSVWVNLDRDANPLSDHLHPVSGILESLGIKNWRVKWWQETILQANWKMAQEAFMEGWHVMRTHPQLTLGAGEATPADSLRHKVYANGHASFEFADNETDFFSFDVMLASAELLAEGLDAMVIDRDVKVLEGLRNKVETGNSIRSAVVKGLRAYYEGAGIPVPDGAENNPMWWSSMIFIFPNTLYLPMYGNALAYRIRPHNNDPEQCRFEVWSLTTYPETQLQPRAVLKGRFAKDDASNWPLIPLQDFSNIERQQKGLHAIGYQGHRLAVEWESGISNMHMELDRRLFENSQA